MILKDSDCQSDIRALYDATSIGLKGRPNYRIGSFDPMITRKWAKYCGIAYYTTSNINDFLISNVTNIVKKSMAPAIFDHEGHTYLIVNPRTPKTLSSYKCLDALSMAVRPETETTPV